MRSITSRDGTTIAFDTFGKGDALILVNGTMGSRIWGENRFAQLLKSTFTVHDYDRRGRGDSTNTSPYSVQKEIEDIEALVYAVGGSAYLCGLSSGAALALRAAAQLGARKITKLAMYEGPYTTDVSILKRWEHYGLALEKADLEGDRDALVLAFLDFVQTPTEEVAKMRQDHTTWQKLISLAPTLFYDYEVNGNTLLIPADIIMSVKIPTLVLNGGASDPAVAADADRLAKYLLYPSRVELTGESHNVNPESIAPVLIDFFKAK